ncbi:hypothetical protein DRW03_25740 [Corallococcus sp. H22C18031201]|nr:hypothetical protein DRW03_25740 [Corallococcus sp. H22C18031201]
MLAVFLAAVFLAASLLFAVACWLDGSSNGVTPDSERLNSSMGADWARLSPPLDSARGPSQCRAQGSVYESAAWKTC